MHQADDCTTSILGARRGSGTTTITGIENPVPVANPSIPALSNKDEENDVNYIHFVTFLGVRDIQVFPFEDIHVQDHLNNSADSYGKGLSMQVLRGQFTKGNRQGQFVAVKQARSVAAGSDAAALAEVRKHQSWLLDIYFELQIMTHKPLCNHPNIVQLLGITFGNDKPGQTTDYNSFSPILIVEPAHEKYIDLARFFDKRDTEDSLSLSDTFSLIGDVADGIAALHAYRVVHGDIKPPNVLIFPAPKEGGVIAKICDFGSSEVIDEPDPARGLTRAWTPSWAAPERNHRSIPTTAHDVYSFGLVAAYIAIGGTVQYPIELTDQSNASTTLLLKKIQAYFSQHQDRIDDYADALVYRLGNVIKSCLLRLPGARMTSLEYVRLDLQGNPGNPASGNGQKLRLQETVVPFQKSICRFNRESAMTDFAQAMVYQGMKKAYHQLPGWLQDRLIQNVYKMLDSSEACANDTELYAAESAYYALHEMGTTRELRMIPRYGNMKDRAALYALFMRLQGKMNSVPDITSLPDPSEQIKKAVRGFPELNDVALLRHLSSKRVKEILARSVDGVTALHVAVHLNRPELIEVLVSLGASVDAMGEIGWTPLHEAIAQLHIECTALLLESGANIDMSTVTFSNSLQWTPLTLLLSIGQINASESPANLTAFWALLKLLLEKGADPWVREAAGLREVASHFRMYGPLSADVMETLLKKDRALANARNSRLETPLMRSAINGAIDVILVLLRYGAEINATDTMGYTALHKLWNNMIPVERIQSKYYPFEADLRPSSLQIRQSRTPVATMKQVMKILIDNGASQTASSGISHHTPSKAGFSNLAGNLGPARLSELLASNVFPFSHGIGTRSFAWFEETMSLYSKLNGMWLFREPDDEEFRSGNVYERAVVSISKPSQCGIRVCLRIGGAFPLDPDWRYFLLIRLGRFSNSGSDFVIDVTLRNTKDGSVLLRHNQLASRLLAQADYMYILILGPIQLPDTADLQLEISTYQAMHTSWHGGIALVDAQFQIEYTQFLQPLVKNQHPPEVRTYSTQSLANKITYDIRNNLQTASSPRREREKPAPPYFLPWLDIPFCQSATKSCIADALATDAGIDHLKTITSNALASHALLAASQTQPWGWSLPWWLVTTVERGVYERELVEFEGAQLGLGAFLGSWRITHRLRRLGSMPVVVHWALHHGVKILVLLAVRVWGRLFFGSGWSIINADTSPVFSYQYVVGSSVGLAATIFLHRYSRSPALLSFVLSRGMFFSPGLSTPHTAREWLFDAEWTWYILCSSAFSVMHRRWYRSVIMCALTVLVGRLAVDLFRGVVTWWDLLPVRFLVASGVMMVCLWAGKRSRLESS